MKIGTRFLENIVGGKGGNPRALKFDEEQAMADVHADEVLQFEEGDARLIAHEKALAESEPDDEITCGGLTLRLDQTFLVMRLAMLINRYHPMIHQGRANHPPMKKQAMNLIFWELSVDGGTPQADSPVDSTPTEPSVVPMEVTPLAETPVATESPVVDSPVDIAPEPGNLPNLVLLEPGGCRSTYFKCWYFRCTRKSNSRLTIGHCSRTSSTC